MQRVVLPGGVDLRRELYLVRRAHGCLSLAAEAFSRYLRQEFLAPGQTDAGAAAAPEETPG